MYHSSTNSKILRRFDKRLTDIVKCKGSRYILQRGKGMVENNKNRQKIQISISLRLLDHRMISKFPMNGLLITTTYRNVHDYSEK